MPSPWRHQRLLLESLRWALGHRTWPVSTRAARAIACHPRKRWSTPGTRKGRSVRNMGVEVNGEQPQVCVCVYVYILHAQYTMYIIQCIYTCIQYMYMINLRSKSCTNVPWPLHDSMAPYPSCCRLSVTLLYFKQTVLLGFQVQWADQWATAYILGGCI